MNAGRLPRHLALELIRLSLLERLRLTHTSAGRQINWRVAETLEALGLVELEHYAPRHNGVTRFATLTELGRKQFTAELLRPSAGVPTREPTRFELDAFDPLLGEPVDVTTLNGHRLTGHLIGVDIDTVNGDRAELTIAIGPSPAA